MTTGSRKPGVFVKTAHHENNNENKNHDNNDDDNNNNSNYGTVILIADIIGAMGAQNWITFIHCGSIYV